MEELRASIAEKQSRATENQSDIRLKEAKVQSEIAKTRKLHADADGVDQDFVRTADGSKLNEELVKQQQKGNQDMNKQIVSNQAKNQSKSA